MSLYHKSRIQKQELSYKDFKERMQSNTQLCSDITYLPLSSKIDQINFDELDPKRTKFIIKKRAIDIRLTSKGNKHIQALFSLYEDYVDIYLGCSGTTWWDYSQVQTNSEIEAYNYWLDIYFNATIIEKINWRKREISSATFYTVHDGKEKKRLKSTNMNFFLLFVRKKTEVLHYTPWINTK